MKLNLRKLLPLLLCSLTTASCATAADTSAKEKHVSEKTAHSSSSMGFVKPSGPTSISTYVVDLPNETYFSAKHEEMKLEPQLLFIDETAANKAFADKPAMQKLIAGVIKASKLDLKSPSGKFLIKGEILAKLNEVGCAAEGVLWSALRF